jgi:SAM-dependent methyltransferase
MFSLLLVALVIFVACFGFVLLFGAPYVPTLEPQVNAALELLNLKKGQTLLELGCGDGKVLVAAAERGYKVVGYELNPLLALVAWARTRKYGDRVRVVWGNFWRQEWPVADGIFVFLLDKFMARLDARIIAQPNRPIKVASYAFRIPGTEPAEEREGVFLYVYQK